MKITKSEFGATKNSLAVDMYTIANARGSYVNILTYGGIVQSFVVGDVDIVLGYDSVAEYEENTCYFGALIGRCGNRIGEGKFTLNNKEYALAVNNGPNHLHGGLEGFDKKIWHAEIKGDGLHLTYKSVDGEEGYPATLDVEVVYALDDENGFYIRYEATADGDTLCNLTNHSYFNMSGHETGDLKDISVQIFADAITECDENTLPTGRILSVQDTPFDFRIKQPILSRITDVNEQLRFGKGYDHNFILNGEGMRLVARCDSAKTGLTLEVHTDQVGMQMYSGNYITPDMEGKNGTIYGFRSAVCFETQGFPDAINHADFPSVVLKKGGTYKTTTIYHVVR